MSDDRLSAIISTSAALVVVLASYFKWFHQTWGGPILRTWAKVMLGLVAAALVTAIVLLMR
jgi:hypothetical protein